MSDRIPVILIFDIGKTNKKLLLFDQQYQVVCEESRQMEEKVDEDGFACEDLNELTDWLTKSTDTFINDKRFEVKAINFAAYGASFVYLDTNLKPLTPLYNYLKPYPGELLKQFYNDYGGEEQFSKTTASPVLGNLNSGMQLYRLKYEKAEIFTKIKYALHLPQYLSFVLSGEVKTEMTSVGCHTNLWNFQQNIYHEWVYKEKLIDKLPEIISADSIIGYYKDSVPVGSGLHDSSSALIPYLYTFNEPFILLSSGTWCISLNPFNHCKLEEKELEQDCLCYLSYEGKPVKASRLFAGKEHEDQAKRLSEHFNKPFNYYQDLIFDKKWEAKPNTDEGLSEDINHNKKEIRDSAFSKRSLERFDNYPEAYHQLIADLVKEQVRSTNLVLKGTSAKRIFVDGGFSNNQIYMHLLANNFPEMEVYAASVPHASALGAALVLHKRWNAQSLPDNLIEMHLYSISETNTK